MASRPSAITATTASLDSYFTQGEERPLKLLVQFDRTLGAFEVTFEDADPTRWKVTPANIDSMSEELRPTFD